MPPVLKSDENKRRNPLLVWHRDSHTDTSARGYYVYSYNSANGRYALVEDQTDLNDTAYI